MDGWMVFRIIAIGVGERCEVSRREINRDQL